MLIGLFLLPLSVIRKTRPLAGLGLFLASYVIGATAWFLGAGLAFAAFGWLGLLAGFLLLGVGAVLVGMAGAGFVFDDWG